jgi:hypothetical protein
MRIILLLVMVFGFSQVALAEACYTKREAEAEQGIRIHSELMVIGLNCAHMSSANGKNLYAEHRKFTADHGKLLARYEKILIDYLARTGVANAEKQLHEIRTNFANKISKDAAVMRPDKFCRTYAPRIEAVTKMDETQFRKWAATPFKEYPVSKPLCP